jgi:DNA-binding MarR family transcriptional regulator
VSVDDPIAEAERNWRDHAWPEPDAMAAVTSVMRAHQILLGRVNAALKPLRLTFARYEVLALLTFSRRGELPLGKIGERLQVHPASVTNAIDRLERDGFVARVPHPTDGRTTLARITDDGRRIVQRATAVLGGIRFGADGLDDRAARTLTSTIEGLRRAAGDLQDDGSPG